MDFLKTLDFSGKRVLVTGGSEGIGYGVAQAFRQHVCTALNKALVARRGCIINVDSVVTETAFRNNPAYTASKIGLKHLNKSLAQKWGKLGIRVNGIGPGLVPTKMTANQTSPEAEAQFKSLVPAGRFGTPDDRAGPVLFLASPLAAYVTGQSLIVDGGLTLLPAL